MKTAWPFSPVSVRPLEGEFPCHQDSPARARIRSRGEALLAEVVASVQQEEQIELPVKLCLYPDMGSMVTIERTKCARLKKPKRKVAVFAIRTSFTWLESAPDAQIKATFAHEVGHAVLGHLEELDEKQEAIAQKKDERLSFWTLLLSLMSFPVLVLSFAIKDGAWDMPIKLLLITHSLLMVSLILRQALPAIPELRISRKHEYEADAFAARFADPQDLINDLAHDKWSRWRTILVFTQTHPTLKQRARALGVKAPSAQS